nr:MAG TPA: hypothetical protein [Caudoviricetes sp.]
MVLPHRVSLKNRGVSSATLFFCTVFSRYSLELQVLLRTSRAFIKNALFFVS